MSQAYIVDEVSHSVTLTSPVTMPKACGYLWNNKMLLQMNCRGYAHAQFMQPEPAKYAAAPVLEVQTFMQPEPHYFAHHPGRFFYVKDETRGALYSLPHEPVRHKADSFAFIVTPQHIRWRIVHHDLVFHLSLQLTNNDVVECWQLRIESLSDKPVKLSVYPYFPVGYLSWMNQSADYHPDLNAIVASRVTPYQKLQDLPRIKAALDKTFFAASKPPASWCANQQVFEGEGGLTKPDGVIAAKLANQAACYEVPTAVMQFPLTLAEGDSTSLEFLFGAAADNQKIAGFCRQYLQQRPSLDSEGQNQSTLKPCLQIRTPDSTFNQFVNQWLPNQVQYQGRLHRLTTDPQTRNFLQDAMGMTYIDAETVRDGFVTALSQQRLDGAMPDGILLHPEAKLKYINQVPHADHCVWLPLCLSAYLDETNDLDFLQHGLPFSTPEGQSVGTATVFEHVEKALSWLHSQRDHRDLLYFKQGDWCDPLNMAGHQGKGVSSWLTLAMVWAAKVWAKICLQLGKKNLADHWYGVAETLATAVNRHLWDGNWFARGITDQGRAFGVSADSEGRIFLNPQSWAMLSGVASNTQIASMVKQVSEQLSTPYGVAMLTPAYTSLQEDIGRLTQKSPGSAENGSVYNHAAAFYALALYRVKKPQQAYSVLRSILVSQGDALAKGQLPVFIPNYYRGAYHQYPDTAGRSSQLLHTGTIAWFYRCLVEGLFGLKGTARGLSIFPQMPACWTEVRVQRQFRGAEFDVHIQQRQDLQEQQITVDGVPLRGNVLSGVEAGKRYSVKVLQPEYVDNE